MKATEPVIECIRFLDTCFENMYPALYFDMPGWIFLYKQATTMIQYEIHHNNAWVNGNVVSKLKSTNGLHHQQAKSILRQKVRQYASIFPRSILEGWYPLPARINGNNGRGPIAYEPLDQSPNFF